MQKQELPAKYYLDHFREMLSSIKSIHGFLLESNHQAFIQTFESLSEDAQCLYIRMSNRKGTLFAKEDFKYSEIEQIEFAWEELTTKKFIRSASPQDESLLLDWLKKDHIKDLLNQARITFKKSASRIELLEILEDQKDKIVFDFSGLVVHESHPTLHYLLFILFGKIQDNLILYTLRDLGIRKSNANNGVKPKFINKEEAQCLYFYQTIRLEQKRDLLNVSSREINSWPLPLNEETKALREKILLNLGDEYKRLELDLEALNIYQLCDNYPSTEKKARLLYDLDRKEECQQELLKMMENPSCDEELLFAEDFLARKFEKKRLSILTETLRNARKIAIDDSYFRHPEFGVLEHFKLQGHTGFFSENFLFSALFGIIFHDELTSREKLHVHSEFDRIPTELLGKEFYLNNRELIETKLQEVCHWNWDEVMERDYSQAELFILDEYSKTMVKEFVKFASVKSLVHMVRYLAENFFERNSGFPDLFVIENGSICFYEVKAEGDSLKRSQLKQMRELEKAGFKVEVLNVHYQYNPQQVYVVIDIETTGHLSPFNRITEVAAVKVKNGEILERFQTLINPDRSIPRDIQALTGITNEMVFNAPRFEQIADSLDEFTKDAIFVAHNVGFDYGFIQKEFERLDRRYVRPYICTKAGMKKYYPDRPSYSLKNLTQAFNIELTQHHRALSDAEAAAELLRLINLKRSLPMP